MVNLTYNLFAHKHNTPRSGQTTAVPATLAYKDKAPFLMNEVKKKEEEGVTESKLISHVYEKKRRKR